MNKDRTIDTTTNQLKVWGAGPFAEWARDEFAKDPAKAAKYEAEAEKAAALATVDLYDERNARVKWAEPVKVLGGSPVTNYYDSTGPSVDFDRYDYRTYPEGDNKGFEQTSHWREQSVRGKRDGNDITGSARCLILRRAAALALERGLNERVLLEARFREAKRADDRALGKVKEAQKERAKTYADRCAAAKALANYDRAQAEKESA